MKLTLLTLICLMFSSLPGVAMELTAEQQATILREAAVAFDRGVQLETENVAASRTAYAEAAERYGLLAQSIEPSGKLLFNLASAQLGAGQLPRALAHFKMAARRLPDSSAIAANVEQTRALLADRSPAAVHIPWQQRMPMDALQWMVIALWNLAWLSIAVGLLQQRWRQWYWRRVSIPTAALCVVLAAILGAAMWGDRQTSEAVVLRDGVVARIADGEGFDPAAATPLAAGDELPILRQRGDWIQITLPEGHAGWVPRNETILIEG